MSLIIPRGINLAFFPYPGISVKYAYGICRVRSPNRGGSNAKTYYQEDWCKSVFRHIRICLKSLIEGIRVGPVRLGTALTGTEWDTKFTPIDSAKNYTYT